VAEVHVSIGQVKRDISDLVNRVAYRGERIVLTSRGKPKAVMVSLEDYERIREETDKAREARWQACLAASDALAARILERRGGEPLDMDTIWREARADLEAQDDSALGR